MRIVAVVTARWESTRLPRKMLADINGRSMLMRVVDRCLSSSVDEVCVATTPSSLPIINECVAHKILHIAGPENDICSRLAYAADVSGATYIVRVWGDSPLTNPLVINRLISEWNDYYAYLHAPKEPKGTSSSMMDVRQLWDDHKNLASRNSRLWYHKYCISQPWSRELESNYDLSHLDFSVDDEDSLNVARCLCTP